MSTKRYTIRNVPNEVDRILRGKASEAGISLNSFLLDVLVKETGIGAVPSEYHDLDFLIGSWVPDPETDSALVDQRWIK